MFFEVFAESLTNDRRIPKYFRDIWLEQDDVRAGDRSFVVLATDCSR